MKNDFEFDKIILAIALSIFLVIFSNALGGFFYRSERIVQNKGFLIEIQDAIGVASKPKTLPEILDLPAIFAEVNIADGEKTFSKCAVCHTNNKGGPNKVGPNLWGIVGSHGAHKDDFKYSEAMSARGKEGKIWTVEQLYRYVYSPKTFVPGNKMAFAGIKDEKQLANLIAYLNTLADNPVALPKS